MIILIGGEKGGTGKSTIATNLAVALAKNYDTILIDADPQCTASKWVSRRERNSSGLSKIHCIQKTGDVFETIRDLASRYQQIIIDAGGRDSEELRSAMVAAQKLYIPIKASQPDLETIERMLKLVSLAKGLNRALETTLLISMVPTYPNSTEASNAREILENISGVNLSDVFIRERKVYRDAMIEGKSVIELENSKAKEEIQNLYKEIYNEQ